MSNRDDKLNTLASQIVENLDGEVKGVNQFKWDRAGLYAQARDLFPSNNEFGDWRQNCCTTGGATESRNVVGKLIACRELLTEEQFVAMGYGKAAALIVKRAWIAHEEQMSHLASIAHLMSKEKVAQAVKDIQSGMQITTPSPKAKSDKEQLDEARVEIGILRGEYVHSDESFFHPCEHLRQMQIDELNKGSKYSCLFFGITKASDVTEEIVKAGYRKLSKQYHPDRGGSQEIMTLINKLNDHFGNIFSLK